MFALQMFRANMQRLFVTFGGSVDVYRSPAASGGTVGTQMQVGTAIPAAIVPSVFREATGLPQEVIYSIAADRVAYLGIFFDTADVRQGDDVVSGTVRYNVEGVGNWQLGQVVALSLPK